MNSFRIFEQGTGHVQVNGDEHLLRLPSAPRSTYSNAMVTSYRTSADFAFAPGTRLELTVHSTGTLHGTAGFGFWNHPIGMGLRLPRAVWFFFSTPPNNVSLAANVPGYGFKAATFDAQRWPFYALLPLAPIGVIMMRVPLLYRMLWPIGQWAIGVDECALDAELLVSPRRYSVDWRPDRVDFAVDAELVFSTRRSPHGKLGFVAWIDNQFAVVTPQGRVSFGLVEAPEPQALLLSEIILTRP